MSSNAKWIALACLLVGGCVEDEPLGPGMDVIVVHAVLNPTMPVQHVDVRHSRRGATGGIPIHGATVTLTAPDGTVHLASEVATPDDPEMTGDFDARYDVAVGALTPGQPYRLRVVTVDGASAEGDAIVPAAPRPQTTAERRFDSRRDTLRLAWPRVNGARAYEVRVIPQKDSTGASFVDTPDGRLYAILPDFVAYGDTSVTIAGMARSEYAPVFQPGAHYDVIVSAVDDHYYEYFAHDSDPYLPTVIPSSLRGGIGVFGAIVPILRQAIVVERVISGP